MRTVRPPAVVFAGFIIAVLAFACAKPPARLVVATTSSAYDTGLLPHLAGVWSAEEAPPALLLLVTGSGEAFTLGRRGDADVLLVHAPDAEAAFMDERHGTLRRAVMRSDFLLVGPANDPADVGSATDLLDAFRRIDAAAVFVSRGDDSGTHLRELQIRAAAALPVPARAGPRYVAAGQGMGETLRMAAGLRAYTLSDRATFEVWRGRVNLVAFTFQHALVENPYSVIVPVSARDSAGARRFAVWLTGPRGQSLIATFRGPANTILFSPAATAARSGRGGD